MSLASCRDFFLERILEFLWRQWSILGAAGGARADDIWAIDPEALLLFSLEPSRYEPRLFDEILEWLIVNGRWLDLQRLRGIATKRIKKSLPLLSAVACFLSKKAKGDQRKWRSLSQLDQSTRGNENESLFLTKAGQPYPKTKQPSEIFQKYGFLREAFSPRSTAQRVSPNSTCTIRFLLRALFGIGSRAECLLYLLTHEAGYPAEVAKAVGISTRGVQDSLIELSQSGLALTRVHGRRKLEYWISQDRWWEFLVGKNLEGSKPVWLNWIDLFSALAGLLDALWLIKPSDSDYLQTSKLRDSMEMIGAQVSRSGLDLPPPPGGSLKPDEYEKEFIRFISSLLGAHHA
jgi:hypothetical protein